MFKLHNLIRFYSLIACIAVATTTAIHAEALFDNYIPDSTTITLKELSVTALKYGKRVDNEAVASSIINQHEIERYNIYSFKDITSIVPNFFVPDYGSRMTSSIYVRGQGTRIDQPVVGMNIDNVPVLNKDNYDFDMLDIEHVEMLRGPQSTLFGRNTMGGVINITTLSPLNYQGTRILASYSSGNTFNVGVSSYHKPTDNLGVSLSVSYNSSDGFFTNMYNGVKTDWEKQGEGRLKLQWRGDNGLKIDNTFSFSISRQGGYPYESAELGMINYNDTCFYRRNSITDGLTVNISREKYTMTSITSYQYIDDNMTLDQDFLPVSYFTLTQARCEHAVTQDIVFKNTESSNSAYSWLAGFFGFYKNSDMDAPVIFKDYGITHLIEEKRNQANKYYPIKWDTRQFLLSSNFNTNNFGFALYHQSTYKLQRFTFSAALRADFEYNRLKYLSQCNTGYSIIDASDGSLFRHEDVNINDPGTVSKNFFQLLPKISISYDFETPSPVSAFLSIAKGYKAGGFNTQMFSDVLQQRLMGYLGIGYNYDVDKIISYKPETNWTFEVGTHAECFNGRIRTDISAFYIRSTNQQLTVFPDGTTTGRIMANAGSARSYGVEFSIKANPVDNLSIAMSYGYTNARFLEFDNGIENYSGKYIPYAPKNTIFAAANYTLPVNKKWLENVSFTVDMSAAGKIYWDESNSETQELYCLPGASIKFTNNHFSLDVWGHNLSNTSYRTFYFVSIENAFFQQGKPRTFGATLRFNI